MRGRITDKLGGYTDYITTVTVTDVAPTPRITPPSAIDATLAATFTGSATSPSTADTNVGFTYAWNFGDGTTGTGASVSHTYAAPGTYTVTLSATDADGGTVTGTTTTTVTVAALPSAMFSAPSSVNEGITTAAVTFSNQTGGSGGYTYSYDFNNSGNFEITGSSSASATIPESYVDDGPATLVVHGRITDVAGGYTDYTTTITVSNVAPTPKITAPSSLVAGSAGTFTASATDPSNADTNTGFTYSWNFGDGSTGSGASASHVYATAGSYTVVLTATDKDGGVGTTSASVTVLTPGQSATASLVGIDTLARGNWQGAYGADGYNVIDGVTSYPAYAQVSASGQSDGVWSQATTDPRALAIPGGGRVAAAWGASTSFTIDINLTDAQRHWLALYLVDFNALGRTERVDVLDAKSSALLASQTVSNFTAGEYLVFSVNGHVTVRVTDLAGPNAVLSGLFFGPPSPGADIITPYDTIPNFGAQPTIVSVNSGNWSSPSTWSLGRLPTTNDVVSIAAGTTVIYDTISTLNIDTVAIQAGGSLTFRTDINTELMLTNLLVLAGGTLNVGTASNPVAATVTAEIVIANTPLNTTTDPSQYGHGLIALGTVNIHGAPNSQSFIELAAEAHAGDTTLQLSQAPINWAVGDKIVLPDTQQFTNTPLPQNGYVAQDETATIASISGTTVTLTAPIGFNHLGARDANGILDYLPQVADLTHNVVIHSQSATGTRGHVLFTYRANVDVEYATFGGLGRTTNDLPDNTTYDSNGNLTHIGTNEAGREPVVFRDLTGPTSAQPDGYQYTFVGNTVTCPLDPMPFRWGIAIDGSHYGLIQDNVVDNWAGAGIVTVQGTESHNVINHNFVVDITGTGSRGDDRISQGDFGFEGSAFWFRGGNNYVTNNVGTDATMYGYNFFVENAGSGTVPAYQGADPSAPRQSLTIDPVATPMLQFSGNEAYGAMTTGLTIWNIGVYGSVTPVANMGQSVVKDFLVWHQSIYGYYGYPTENFVFDHFVARGDSSTLSNPSTLTTGMWFSDYLTQNFKLENADIQGEQVGILAPFKVGDTGNTQQAIQTFTVQNSYLANYYDIQIGTMYAVTGGGTGLSPRQIVLNNDVFASVDMTDRVGDPQQAIMMVYRDGGGPRNLNLIQLDQVFVYNYNGVVGDNFQVFYQQQAGGYVVPQSNSDGNGLVGSPVTGLTNQQTWSLYGIAIAGAIAPSTAQTMDRVLGLVESI
jgi:PKD repeat protein